MFLPLQIIILEWCLKDHLTLKTAVMSALLHLYSKIYRNIFNELFLLYFIK